MSSFPLTEIGGVSVSRLVAGSNWFLGFSHQTQSRAKLIQQLQSADSIADVLEVFLRAGVNVTMGTSPLLTQAARMAEQRVGAKLHLICTPNPKLTPEGPDWDDWSKQLDMCAGFGATFCWPHQIATDNLYDGLTGQIRCMGRICQLIRQRGMIPGLSSHDGRIIRAADRQGLDVASYICIYNAAGFLMNMEIDWAQRVIHGAAKPVTTIKPMAAGRLMPYVGLPFSWATLRDIDLVTVGTTTADEAKEVIEISLAALQRRQADRQLQFTRSKADLVK